MAYTVVILGSESTSEVVASASGDEFAFAMRVDDDLPAGSYVLIIRAYNFPYAGNERQPINLDVLPSTLLASEYQVTVNLR